MALRTACTLDCTDGCSLVVEEGAGGRLVVRGDPDHPITQGYCCAKVARWANRLRDPERLTSPLLRDGAGWRPLDWDQALDLCARHVEPLVDRPGTMLHLTYAGDNGFIRTLYRYFFGRLGASFLRGSLCSAAGEAAQMADFGGVRQNEPSHLAEAKRIVLWGKDPRRSSVHLAGYTTHARKQGAQVWALSVGGGDYAGLADRVTFLRPGCDRFLAAGVLRHLLDLNLLDPKAQGATANWPALRDLLERADPRDLARQAGVDPAEVAELAAWYADRVATVLGWGVTRHPLGGQNVRWVDALCLLSGQIGRADGGLYFSGPAAESVNTGWAQPATPPRTFLRARLADELGQADPPVALAWVTGCNLVNQAPDSGRAAEAFARIPFKVVSDAFMTDTAQRADLVLPCALMFEKEDLAASYSHRWLHLARQVVAPPPGAKSDEEILRALNARLGQPLDLPDHDRTLELLLDSPFIRGDLASLRRDSRVEVDLPELPWADLVFAHTGGKATLVEVLDPEPPAPEGYALRLLTLVRRNQLHSQTTLGAQEGLPVVRVHPDHAPKGAGETEMILSSPVGAMPVAVQPDPTLPTGVVIARRGGWMAAGWGFNLLTEQRVTDMADQAAYYGQYVRLEPKS